LEALKSWDELTVLEQLQCQYWDMYKDAFGCRPRGIDTSKWTEEDFRTEFDQLGDIINIESARREEAEKEAVTKFEIAVTAIIGCGAGDRATALRWIMDASDCDGDWEYFCYCNGLPYRYFTKV
jgi:hypothetical protein